MIKRILFFLIGLISCTEIIYAQENIVHCGHEQYMQQLAIQQPNVYKQILQLEKQLTERRSNSNLRIATLPDVIISIPVVVHVIHHTASGTIGGSNNTNISDQQIQSQITVLNKDFQRLNSDANQTPIEYQGIAANCKITFCLATTDPSGNATTGITRTYSSKLTFSTADDVQLKALSYWPSDKYLNIWTCDLRDPSVDGELLGYAQKPGASSIPGLDPTDGAAKTDGVVINYKAFGTIGTLFAKFNLGRTATHEIGHWLGLSHTWGDFESGNCFNTDYCDDTPACGNKFASSYPTCSNIPKGQGSVVCSPARMIENYMDYSDDGCLNLFTLDQKSRMRSAIELSPRRAALLNSLGCCNVLNLKNLFLSKNFEDGSLTSEDWTVINPNSSSTYTKGFELNTYSAFGQGNFSTSVTNDSIYNQEDPSTYKYEFSYVSPFINVQTSLIPIVRFDWAYSPQVTNGNTDSIVVYVATGCEDNWSPIKTLYGNDFNSTNNPRSNFVPLSDEWITTELNLSAYTVKTAIRIKFVSFSKGVNTFYLDNINFGAISNSLLISLYPNPTKDVLNVQTIFSGQKNVDYIIYNVLGQLIYEAHDEHVYCYTKQLDLSFMASGVYFMLVSNGDQKVVKRIVKE